MQHHACHYLSAMPWSAAAGLTITLIDVPRRTAAARLLRQDLQAVQGHMKKKGGKVETGAKTPISMISSETR